MAVLDACPVTCGVGGKSGKRKAGRAGIFDFLFLNFFATQISSLSIIAVLPFLLLSALFYWVGSLYYFVRKREQTAIKSGNIFGIR